MSMTNVLGAAGSVRSTLRRLTFPAVAVFVLLTLVAAVAWVLALLVGALADGVERLGVVAAQSAATVRDRHDLAGQWRTAWAAPAAPRGGGVR